MPHRDDPALAQKGPTGPASPSNPRTPLRRNIDRCGAVVIGGCGEASDLLGVLAGCGALLGGRTIYHRGTLLTLDRRGGVCFAWRLRPWGVLAWEGTSTTAAFG
jgi:hypothetical protein